jgi:hypothetical protein
MQFLETMAKYSPIVTAASAVMIAFFVHRYNVRRDKEGIREKVWSAQQAFNMECIKNTDLVRAGEIIFVDLQGIKFSEEDFSRAIYVTFIQINRSKLIWNAWKSGIFSRKDMEEELGPILMLVRNEKIFNYCLTRGYSKAFSDDLKNLRARAMVNFEPPKSIEGSGEIFLR